jgi:dihydrofolate reductase
MRIVVLNHLSLDGVMQGPGREEEDTRDGFSHGGWAIPDSDEVMLRETGPGSRQGGGGLLLGRRSYEEMLMYWNQQGGPFKDALNNAPKYVASHSAATKLLWPNSTLVHGEVADEIRKLKAQPGGDLLIMGSGVLIRSLLPDHLIDELTLVIHPVILGSGQRMFSDRGGMARLRLIKSVTTPKGVIIASYQPGVETGGEPALTASQRVETS